MPIGKAGAEVADLIDELRNLGWLPRLTINTSSVETLDVKTEEVTHPGNQNSCAPCHAWNEHRAAAWAAGRTPDRQDLKDPATEPSALRRGARPSHEPGWTYGRSHPGGVREALGHLHHHGRTPVGSAGGWLSSAALKPRRSEKPRRPGLAGREDLIRYAVQGGS